MSGADNAVLPVTVVRGLNDRLYDKRKMAALEVERIVRELISRNDTKQVRRVIEMLINNFALSQNSNSRKGGLIGLAATAIALGKDIGLFLSELIPPVLKSFSDVDSRVRYFACEAMYNIAKVARGSMLLFFKETFDGISKLVCDPDIHVHNGAQLLDRLIKDVVTESNIFDVDQFVTLVRDRIYTNNEFVRQFLVSWIQLLCSVPDVDLVAHLPQLLDGLFMILSDPSHEITAMTQQVLNEFLGEISKDSRSTNFNAMMHILIAQSRSTHKSTQLAAMVWMHRFLELDGPNLTQFSAGVLSAILPCLAYQENKTENYESAVKTKETLLSLLTDQPSTLHSMEVEDMVTVLVAHLIPGTNYTDKSGTQYTSPVNSSNTTKVSILQWLLTLHSFVPDKIYSQFEEIFPMIIKTVSDPSDEVVELDLQVLAAICDNGARTDYFDKFMMSLVTMFNNDQKLLEKRGTFIIEMVCSLLEAEKVYCGLALILCEHTDITFTALMVQYLNWILLTTPQLASLRKTLKQHTSISEEGRVDKLMKRSRSDTSVKSDVFMTLYNTWCHDPVSTIALCLMSHSYQHASEVIHALGALEMTELTLSGLDRLVQLLESPVFASLRLELVCRDTDPALIRSLAGILMLLPQSEAFALLRQRLECVGVVRSAEVAGQGRLVEDKQHLKELLSHFNTVQARHSLENLSLVGTSPSLPVTS